MKRVIFTGIMMLLLIFSCTTEHIDSAGTVVVTKTDLSGLTSATGTIKFSANSGSGTMADMTADASSETSLPLCSFTAPSGKKFGHWNTSADGSGYSYIDGAKVKDLAAALLTAKKDNGTIVTLYAQWIDTTAPIVELAKIYTIRLDNNGGDGTMDDMTSDSGAEFALPLCSFTAPRGKKFGSWNTKADGSGIAYADKTSFTHIAKGDNEIVILYAQWIDKDAHRIIYIDPQNVTSTQIVSFKESEDVTLITPQAAIGYAFKGWYLTAVPAESDEAVIGWSAGAKTDDVVVYADWDVAVYTISYRDAGDAAFTGSTEGLPTSHTYGKKTSLVSPKRSSYTFLGWYLTSNCAGNRLIELGGKDVTSDITLFAKWEVCLECSAEELSTLLASLDVTTDSYKIKITDSNPDQAVLRTALTNNSTKNVWLDLSECDGITEIKQEAFKDCVNLINVSLPDSLRTIYNGAFSGCVGLTSLVIPDTVTFIGNEVFSGCTRLTDLTLSVVGGNCTLKQMFGDSVVETLTSVTVTQSFGSNAFKDCNNLTAVKLGDDVMSIGESAFSGCSGLRSVTIPDSVTSIGENVFNGCNELTSIRIESCADFSNAGLCFRKDNIKYQILNKNYIAVCSDSYFGDIVIPVTVTCGNTFTVMSISESAFSGCGELASVTIPNSVTSIGNSAFKDCTGLIRIEIANGVTSISNSVFEGCSGITSIDIPDGVTSIGSNAFKNCTGLTSIVIPDNVTSIGYSAFLNTGLTGIVIPDSVTSIGNTAFQGCDNLTRAILPSGLKKISRGMFLGCQRLDNIQFPDVLEEIQFEAFKMCISLTSVTIPDSVKSIDSYAFDECQELITLTVKATIPPSSGPDMFYRCYALTTIYVPAGSVEAYKAADGWKNYSQKMVGRPFGISFVNIEENVTKSVNELTEYLSILSDKQTANITISDINPSLAEIKGALMSYPYIKVNLNMQGCSGMTSIGESAFADCRGLASIKIPDSVTSISAGAFDNCFGLSEPIYNVHGFYRMPYSYRGSYIIPNYVTSIRPCAFEGCSLLTSVTIPESVTSIGIGVFGNCGGLVNIYVDEGNNVYDSRNNCNAIIETDTNELIAGCRTTSIPNSVTRIGNNAFAGCLGLKSIVIPNGVVSIGDAAFNCCDRLTSIEIPDSVTSIGKSTFICCRYLTNVTIGESVTSIGEAAFSGCSDLTTLTVKAINPPIFGSDMLYDCSALTNIYVPADSVDAYKAASGWKDYASKIKAIPEP